MRFLDEILWILPSKEEDMTCAIVPFDPKDKLDFKKAVDRLTFESDKAENVDKGMANIGYVVAPEKIEDEVVSRIFDYYQMTKEEFSKFRYIFRFFEKGMKSIAVVKGAKN